MQAYSQMWVQLADLSYLAAAALFIFALKAMSSPKTARRGNLLGALGMLIAIVVTLIVTDKFAPLGAAVGVSGPHVTYVFIIIGMVVGSSIGAYLAMKVKMTAMPQMVAAFNGLGGLASALVVLAGVFATTLLGAGDREFVISSAVSTIIGWVTFTGSMVAFAKLQEVVISGKPLVFPYQRTANFAALGLAVLLAVAWGYWPEQRWLIIPLGLISAVLGVMFVIPIGGADMPVIISLLNSYSGFAAAATGFVLGNSGLIVAGALVGASGLILTSLMCRAMNRSLANVLFAAVGSASAAGAAGDETRNVRSWTALDAAMTLEASSLVVIVPGYGLAVAQAQHAVKELSTILGERGVTVKFGIHPVAGRMPGHMNVLLAEAEVPYEQLSDIDEINSELPRADVALVIGANDVVNPSARHDKASPLYGMPILDVDKARTVMICKRSMNPGFAGVENELFYAENASMLFGDAKKMVSDIVTALKG
jgi:NAD(P) transhydrogenase subunit beta